MPGGTLQHLPGTSSWLLEGRTGSDWLVAGVTNLPGSLESMDSSLTPLTGTPRNRPMDLHQVYIGFARNKDWTIDERPHFPSTFVWIWRVNWLLHPVIKDGDRKSKKIQLVFLPIGGSHLCFKWCGLPNSVGSQVRSACSGMLLHHDSSRHSCYVLPSLIWFWLKQMGIPKILKFMVYQLIGGFKLTGGWFIPCSSNIVMLLSFDAMEKGSFVIRWFTS